MKQAGHSGDVLVCQSQDIYDLNKISGDQLHLPGSLPFSDSCGLAFKDRNRHRVSRNVSAMRIFSGQERRARLFCHAACRSNNCGVSFIEKPLFEALPGFGQLVGTCKRTNLLLFSVSDDFESWSAPVRMSTTEGGAENPGESDNQWQPGFINWRDETLFCAWSDFVARRVFVAVTNDGLRLKDIELANALSALKGKASGFPTNHGLLTSKGTMLFPCIIPFTYVYPPGPTLPLPGRP